MEYIERKAASAAMPDDYYGWRDKQILNFIPAADVVPVRYGRWIKTIGENGVTSACRCNLCGFEDNRFSLFSYCPNCGARMDEDGDT